MSQTTPTDQPITTQPTALPSPLPASASASASASAPALVVTGADVKRLRGRVGATQAELADELGYSRSSICRWESHPEKAIPAAQIDKTLAFFRARYNVAENRRVQLADLKRHLGDSGQNDPSARRAPARPRRDRIH